MGSVKHLVLSKIKRLRLECNNSSFDFKLLVFSFVDIKISKLDQKCPSYRQKTYV